MSLFVGGVVVALLVGWVLAWSNEPDGPNALWLTLGSVAFTAVLTLLAMLVLSLRASHRLREAETALLTGASHNLRTPLAAIRTASQTLRTAHSLSPDDRALLVDAILHETGRLELRIDNFIETARVDLEPRLFADAIVDLGELVGGVVSDARWALTAARGAGACDADDELLVRGDPVALKLLFENLVDNAIKYADGAPDVHVTATRSGEHAVVRVSDAGIGFERGTAELLFRRFHRGDTGRHGSGLGLALGRAIARRHGGDVLITSPGRGAGATAEVWLPLVEPRQGDR
ncbi:MAG: HAMP domain-containing histidine kinase [Deltaproteobacteria bacterium]|nr:HAMP domain-containing histidine kinase [Deltaproteobacteria bacterium]